MTNKPDVSTIQQFHTQLKENLHKIIVGYGTLIDTMTIALLSRGHILIEGTPGTAKTSICRLFSGNIGGTFGRLQGAVDVQPADVTGLNMYKKETDSFVFNKGPIFSNVFLADEINRLTPKTQGALLESLAEQHVTIDNKRYELLRPFITIATQNPHEMEGTFQLIDAQKDRFAYSVNVSHLSVEDEIEILSRELKRDLDIDDKVSELKPVATLEKIEEMQNLVRDVYASPEIIAYIADIVDTTRKHDEIKLGVSTRGSLALLRGSQVYAAINGRNYIIPDDVKFIVPFALEHRISLKHEAVLSGRKVGNVLDEILDTVAVR